MLATADTSSCAPSDAAEETAVPGRPDGAGRVGVALPVPRDGEAIVECDRWVS